MSHGGLRGRGKKIRRESVSVRPQNRHLKRGGSPGRPRGVPNKVTLEIREAAQRLVEDAEYRGRLRTRLLKGTAGAMEILLWHYAYGKPKDTVDPGGDPDSPVVIKLVWEDVGIGGGPKAPQTTPGARKDPSSDWGEV